MDEWFEWVDKETYINESTLFFDGEELMNSMNQSKVEDELKKLAMDYIKATNAKDLTLAETILHNMEELKKLTNV